MELNNRDALTRFHKYEKRGTSGAWRGVVQNKKGACSKGKGGGGGGGGGAIAPSAPPPPPGSASESVRVKLSFSHCKLDRLVDLTLHLTLLFNI